LRRLCADHHQLRVRFDLEDSLQLLEVEMGESFLYMGHRIDTTIVERAGCFDWSYQIDGRKPVYSHESSAQSVDAAESEAEAAARLDVDLRYYSFALKRE
jgi:hypothetical protein